jgi:hypothetical protein
MEKCAINAITMGNWNNAVEGKSYQNIIGPHGLGTKIRDDKCSLTFVK